jgi:hypothetical protein
MTSPVVVLRCPAVFAASSGQSRNRPHAFRRLVRGLVRVRRTSGGTVLPAKRPRVTVCPARACPRSNADPLGCSPRPDGRDGAPQKRRCATMRNEECPTSNERCARKLESNPARGSIRDRVSTRRPKARPNASSARNPSPSNRRTRFGTPRVRKRATPDGFAPRRTCRALAVRREEPAERSRCASASSGGRRGARAGRGVSGTNMAH